MLLSNFTYLAAGLGRKRRRDGIHGTLFGAVPAKRSEDCLFRGSATYTSSFVECSSFG